MLNKSHWTYNLPGDVYLRLCECRTIKSDLPYLVNARWGWMKGRERYSQHTKEDALVYILELLDANSQWELAALKIKGGKHNINFIKVGSEVTLHKHKININY